MGSRLLSEFAILSAFRIRKFSVSSYSGLDSATVLSVIFLNWFEILWQNLVCLWLTYGFSRTLITPLHFPLRTLTKFRQIFSHDGCPREWKDKETDLVKNMELSSPGRMEAMMRWKIRQERTCGSWGCSWKSRDLCPQNTHCHASCRSPPKPGFAVKRVLSFVTRRKGMPLGNRELI